MATDKTIRDALQDVIASELRNKWDGTRPPMDVVGPAIRATGLRRAVWGTLTPTGQKRLLNAAMRQARSVPIEEH